MSSDAASVVIVEALEVIAWCVGPFELIEFAIAEFHVDGGNCVVDLRDRVGPDDRGRHHRAMVQPRQGDCGAGNTVRRGDIADGVDDGAVGIGCLVGV